MENKTDPFGHTIQVGTKVRFFAKGYRFKTIEATVSKMTDKTLELEHEHFNIPGHRTTTKQGYAQVFVDTTGWVRDEEIEDTIARIESFGYTVTH